MQNCDKNWDFFLFPQKHIRYCLCHVTMFTNKDCHELFEFYLFINPFRNSVYILDYFL